MGAVGSYTRFIPNGADQDEFNRDVRRAHDGLDPINPRATAEQIKQVFEENTACRYETRVTNKRNADEFCALSRNFWIMTRTVHSSIKPSTLCLGPILLTPWISLKEPIRCVAQTTP